MRFKFNIIFKLPINSYYPFTKYRVPDSYKCGINNISYNGCDVICLKARLVTSLIKKFLNLLFRNILGIPARVLIFKLLMLSLISKVPLNETFLKI